MSHSQIWSGSEHHPKVQTGVDREMSEYIHAHLHTLPWRCHYYYKTSNFYCCKRAHV